MKTPPEYFERVRTLAAKRWDQLESDRDLAGPWHQLFRQVQSPRHILSELLQNAEDAKATEASVRIEDGRFVFTHNGDDFTEENLASLCRFGYSDKRALHTIGFRGIGFKSTFSLGDTVELHTSTLSIEFHRRRFTEPTWKETASGGLGLTEISVAISDKHRQLEVEQNLQEWLNNPVSLLLFENLRLLRVGDQEVRWQSLGQGPIAGSEWMALHNEPGDRFLLLQSQPEAFPEDALLEINQERLLSDELEGDFPPCKVKLVLGAKGRLYVVLPTGVETNLPFACDAPFIQDPARLKIKDPETSPTNRWLLERIGRFAGQMMLEWLQNDALTLTERADAYALLPPSKGTQGPLEQSCFQQVQRAFSARLRGQLFLLADSGDLLAPERCIAIPTELAEVWPSDQLAAFFDDERRLPLSTNVAQPHRQTLIEARVLQAITRDDVLKVLEARHLPRPPTWNNLLRLWVYLAPEMLPYQYKFNEDAICILPVQGKDVLYASNEIVRLGERRLLQSDEDWEFLAQHLIVLNQNWTRFLTESRRTAEEEDDTSAKRDVDAALRVLRAVELAETSDMTKVMERIGESFFTQASVPVDACIQIAQIAAKLGATAGKFFRFATRDRLLRSKDDAVVFDGDGTIESFFPDSWNKNHLLHTGYSESFDSCSEEEWQRWISSGRAGISEFVPIGNKFQNIWGRPKIIAELRRRGFTGEPEFRYVHDSFHIRDWDFEQEHWEYWRKAANEDNRIWGHLLERVLSQPEGFWGSAKSAQVLQVASNGHTRAITNAPLLPNWILRFKTLPCLRDTRGFYHKPDELLRRTSLTESLLDVEPFIDVSLDTEANRPLLRLLGVGELPTGPEKLLDRIRALALTETPPLLEIDKWYRRLDQMVETCSTSDFSKIKDAFAIERLILTNGGSWSTAAGVFLSANEDDVPGAVVVRPSVADLTLWRKIEVADRPTAELAIEWLQKLPSGAVLDQDDARRVRALLPRYAARIWNECEHWMNLAGEWVPAHGLKYALTMQSLVSWSHLHGWVKQQTADLRLSMVITEEPPFSTLPRLATRIEDRFLQRPLQGDQLERRAWLNQFGVLLQRIKLDNDEETGRVRGLAVDLAETSWCISPALEVVPYIDGTPAGTASSTDSLWLDRVLYVEQLTDAKLARLVPERVGRAFNRPDVTAALSYCYGRSPDQVSEYMEQNFDLGPIDNQPKPKDELLESQSDRVEPESKATAFGNKVANESPIPPGGSGSLDELAIPGHLLEGADEENGEVLVEDNEPPRVHANAKPRKPSIIERFARDQGFQPDEDDRFYHADGSWLGKTHGEVFPWERRNSSGQLVRKFWPKDHCLERESLQVDASVWGLLEKFPDIHALILTNLQDEPIEVSGKSLCAMRDGGELTLYPASYRLVVDE